MFILDQDKSFIIMPIYYHPTTVLSVDDDKDFLDALEVDVSDYLSLLCFDNPEAAIQHVTNSRLQIPFIARLGFKGQSDTNLCGFSKLRESTIQDFIHPFPEDLDMSFVKPKEELTDIASEVPSRIHEAFDDFKRSQYILTEKSLYYFNKLSNECKWISSDSAMLKKLNSKFLKEIEILNNNQLNEITMITQHYRPTKLDFSITDVRNELYNKYRFKEIIMVTTDYDMPGKTGIEFIKSVAFPGITLDHVLIIITGKNSEEFKVRLGELSSPTEYIVKEEPEWVDKLLRIVKEKTSRIFQDCSQKMLRILSEDINEEACFVFNREFGDIFTSYIKENNICEMYLFDRQGSYLFLDENVDLSWFIIRSEKGMENSIQKAMEYGASESVIDALKTGKFVLSLYEDYDFSKFKKKSVKTQLASEKEKEGQEAIEKKKEIDWDKYLHPAAVFESKTNRLEALGIKLNGNYSDEARKYYYAFIKDFPENGIDKNRILSYKEFLGQSPYE